MTATRKENGSLTGGPGKKKKTRGEEDQALPAREILAGFDSEVSPRRPNFKGTGKTAGIRRRGGGGEKHGWQPPGKASPPR